MNSAGWELRCAKMGRKSFKPDVSTEQTDRSAAHLRKMYDRISGLAKIGVWEYDLVREELSWTDTVYDLFDLPRQAEISRDDVLRLYDSDSRREMERLREEAILSGTGFALDIRIRTALGNDRWIRLTADIEQEDGKSVRIFGTKQDISPEYTAQEKLRTLQSELIHVSRASAMDAMASTLAHVVNQPLTAATNYLEAARRMAKHESVTPELARSIDAALKSSLRAGNIIRRLRDVPREELGIKAPLDLPSVVKEAVAIARAGWPEIVVSCNNLARSPRIVADRVQIQQLFINLIRNACQATVGTSCEISISSLLRETHLEVCVRDTGPGIPEDILPDVFECFVTTKPKGLGVGLSISRTIVEDHGGHIEARNLPDGGAEMRFTLPCSPRCES